MAETEKTTRSTKGREQKRQMKPAKLRTPDLARYYKHRLPTIVPGDFEFRLGLLRPRQPRIALEKMCESFEWIDEAAVLTGSLTLHRPELDDPLSLPIARGHLVNCQVRWGASRTYDLWTMRAEAPQIEVETGVVTVPLKDDLAKLEEGKADWFFRTTKHRKHGWYLHEIAQEVARRRGFKLGNVMRGTVRQTLVKRGATPLAVLRAAAVNEKNANGRSIVMRLRDGKLDIVPLAYNPTIYVLSAQIQTALIAQKAGTQVPWTVLTGRAHIGSGKHTRKISYTAYDRTVVKALGYVPHTKDYGRVGSHAELRNNVKRDLAASLRMNDTISISHQGIPFILRGDAAQIQLPREGYRGRDAFVFATRADHTVQAGTYQTSWDFTAKDPILAQKEADLKALQARLAKSSGVPGSGGGGPRWRIRVSAEDDPPGASASCGPLPADRRGYSVLSVSGRSSDAGTAGQALSPGSVWPCGIALRIENPRTGQVARNVPHVDNGAGSDAILPVCGVYPQTRADIGVGSGDYVIISREDGGNLHPVRGTPA